MSAINNNMQSQVSVEYFPAKGLVAERALMTGAHAMRRFQLSSQTLTCGTGRSAVEASVDWSIRLQQLNGIETASHVALGQFNKGSLKVFLQDLWGNGIQKLVVLRGDDIAPDGQDCAGYSSVADAIQAIKTLYPFDISVAAYPEIHPKARSLDKDLEIVLEKQKAGADRAITQYFFDNDVFYRFCTLAQEKGVHIPIIPGVMPIRDFAQIQRFSRKCGTSIPESFEVLFTTAGDDLEKHSDIARQLIETQVRDLAKNGVNSLHVYSLNRIDLTACAIRAFQEEWTDHNDNLNSAMAG